jgi:hypothetical protein
MFLVVREPQPRGGGFLLGETDNTNRAIIPMHQLTRGRNTGGRDANIIADIMQWVRAGDIQTTLRRIEIVEDLMRNATGSRRSLRTCRELLRATGNNAPRLRNPKKHMKL